MNRIWILLAAAALVFGCSRDETVDKGSNPAPLATKSPEPAPKMDSKNPADPPKTEPVTPAVKDPKSGAPKVTVLHPEPRRYKIEPTGKGVWQPSKMRVGDLASKVGKAMQALRNTYSETLVTIKTPTENGQVKGQVKIRDSSNFSIQYLSGVNIRPSLSEIRADGTKRGLAPEKGVFTVKKPLSSSFEPSLSSAELAQKWPRLFTHLIYSGVAGGQDTWPVLAKGLSSGETGFKAGVSERVMTFRGKLVKSYRITAKRSTEGARAHGPCDIEIVIDGNLYLPVTIRVNSTVPRQGSFMTLWQGGWNFNRKFDPQEFAL